MTGEPSRTPRSAVGDKAEGLITIANALCWGLHVVLLVAVNVTRCMCACSCIRLAHGVLHAREAAAHPAHRAAQLHAMCMSLCTWRACNSQAFPGRLFHRCCDGRSLIRQPVYGGSGCCGGSPYLIGNSKACCGDRLVYDYSISTCVNGNIVLLKSPSPSPSQPPSPRQPPSPSPCLPGSPNCCGNQTMDPLTQFCCRCSRRVMCAWLVCPCCSLHMM